MTTIESKRRKIGGPLALLTVTAVLFGPVQPGARADVVDSAAGGFTVKVTVNIHAAPAEVYRRLVNNIGDWWNPAHTFSGDAHNLSIDDRPNGCLCEKLPNGGSVRHLEVIYVQPGKLLRMTGGLGPLQSLAVAGVATFTIAPEADGTRLELTYSVGGYSAGGLNFLSQPVDMVLTEQMKRLKNYVETGKAGAEK